MWNLLCYLLCYLLFMFLHRVSPAASVKTPPGAGASGEAASLKATKTFSIVKASTNKKIGPPNRSKRCVSTRMWNFDVVVDDDVDDDVVDDVVDDDVVDDDVDDDDDADDDDDDDDGSLCFFLGIPTSVSMTGKVQHAPNVRTWRFRSDWGKPPFDLEGSQMSALIWEKVSSPWQHFSWNLWPSHQHLARTCQDNDVSRVVKEHKFKLKGLHCDCTFGSVFNEDLGRCPGKWSRELLCAGRQVDKLSQGNAYQMLPICCLANDHPSPLHNMPPVSLQLIQLMHHLPSGDGHRACFWSLDFLATA